MTCIVGIIENGKVTIGGDSAGVAGLDVTLRKDAKVFKTGEFIFGCTTSFRMINILRFSFSPPSLKENQDVYEYMCTLFVNELRRVFKDGGFATKDSDGQEFGGTFLVGFRGRLFTICDNYQVAESLDSFAATGCGTSYALGSLESFEGEPKQRIEKALNVACKFSGGVRPPFTIITTE